MTDLLLLATRVPFFDTSWTYFFAAIIVIVVVVAVAVWLWGKLKQL